MQSTTTTPARSREHRDGRFCNLACARCDAEFARQAARNDDRRSDPYRGETIRLMRSTAA